MLDFDALSRRLWTRRTVVSLLLLPLSLVYASLLGARRVLYAAGILHAYRLPVPVLVVGNFVAGGTGKTPLVIALAQALAERGMRPAVVSRGYGGRDKGPSPVGLASAAVSVGDEPLLLARRLDLPVWIGRDRVGAAHALLRRHPEVDVIILDDGLQHRRLARDFEIAVFDERGTGNGLLLPAGPLRECPRRVDAIVRNSTVHATPASVSRAAALPAPVEFEMRLCAAGFYRVYDGTEVELDWLRARRLHAAAAIGQPERFFATLRAMGLEFTPHAFPDHHLYAPQDLRFADCDAVLVTEKDAVKCVMDSGSDLIMLRVEAEIDPALIELVTDRIDRRSSPHLHG